MPSRSTKFPQGLKLYLALAGTFLAGLAGTIWFLVNTIVTKVLQTREETAKQLMRMELKVERLEEKIANLEQILKED